eukprot:UN10813
MVLTDFSARLTWYDLRKRVTFYSINLSVGCALLQVIMTFNDYQSGNVHSRKERLIIHDNSIYFCHYQEL